MKTAKRLVDKDLTISAVDPRLFGAFLEHMERAVYSGIYEPGHPSADADGFRTDVLRFGRVHGPLSGYARLLPITLLTE